MHAVQNRSLTEQLNHRLSEAWQSLWDSFVDPREAYTDDGHEWTALGSLAAGGRSALPFTTEHDLAEIRGQCRTLAVENEFAINGHENRISFLVGDGHTYRTTLRKGTSQNDAAGDPGLADRRRRRPRADRRSYPSDFARLR